MNNFERITTKELIHFFKQNHIAVVESGGSVSRKCIGICCPFCNDKKFHMGVFKDSKNFSCFKCGKSGGFLYLLKALHIPESKLDKFSNRISRHEDFKKESTNVPEVFSYPLPRTMPVGMHNILLTEDFIHERQLDKHNLILNTVSYGIPSAKEFANRMIFPIRRNHSPHIIGAIGRSMLRLGRWRYIIRPDRLEISRLLFRSAPVPLEKYLPALRIVEGPIDCFRLGQGTLALLGSSMSSTQAGIIRELSPKRVTVALDRDAYKKSVKFAYDFFFASNIEVKVLKLPENKDPADLGLREIIRIESETESIS